MRQPTIQGEYLKEISENVVCIEKNEQNKAFALLDFSKTNRLNNHEFYFI